MSPAYFLQVAQVPARMLADSAFSLVIGISVVYSRALYRARLRAGRGQQPFDQRRHLRRLCRHVVAEVEIEGAALHEIARSLAFAAARGRDEYLAGQPGFLDCRGGADVHAVPEADDAAKVGVLLQDGLGDRLGLGRVPVSRLAGDDVDLGMLGEHVSTPFSV